MQRYNKATAAVLAGAVVTVIGGFVALAPEMKGAIQTLVTALIVFLVPNQEA